MLPSSQDISPVVILCINGRDGFIDSSDIAVDLFPQRRIKRSHLTALGKAIDRACNGVSRLLGRGVADQPVISVPMRCDIINALVGIDAPGSHILTIQSIRYVIGTIGIDRDAKNRGQHCVRHGLVGSHDVHHGVMLDLDLSHGRLVLGVGACSL